MNTDFSPPTARERAHLNFAFRRHIARVAQPNSTMKLIVTFALSLLAARVHAWDYEGHRAVNLLAFAALPTSFPAFALTPEARERVAFLSGEPDRWRNMG